MWITYREQEQDEVDRDERAKQPQEELDPRLRNGKRPRPEQLALHWRRRAMRAEGLVSMYQEMEQIRERKAK